MRTSFSFCPDVNKCVCAYWFHFLCEAFLQEAEFDVDATAMGIHPNNNKGVNRGEMIMEVSDRLGKRDDVFSSFCLRVVNQKPYLRRSLSCTDSTRRHVQRWTSVYTQVSSAVEVGNIARETPSLWPDLATHYVDLWWHRVAAMQPKAWGNILPSMLSCQNQQIIKCEIWATTLDLLWQQHWVMWNLTRNLSCFKAEKKPEDELSDVHSGRTM